MEGGYERPAERPAASETLRLLVPDAEPLLPVWKPLTREELASAAGGPGWKALRSRLVLLFCLSWLGMLGAAVAVIIRSPPPRGSALRWWQAEVFYRLQPSLLLDAQNSIPCALNKVSDRFPHFRSLGIRVMILEGLFRQDVSPLNLTQIDQKLGTLAQFHQLIADSHKTGIRVILALCELNLFNRTEFSNETAASVYVQNSLRYWLEQGVSGFEICYTDSVFSEKTRRDWTGLSEAFSTENNERVVMLRQTEASSPGFSVLEEAFSSSPGFSVLEEAFSSFLVEVLLSKPLLSTSTQPLSTAELSMATQTRLKMVQADRVNWTSVEVLQVDGAAVEDLKKVVMVLLMTLPGTPIISYGDEISQTTDEISQITDEIRHTTRRSQALFRALSRIRAREETLLLGNITFLPVNSTSLSSAPTNSTATPPLAFLRSWACVHLLVLLNFGSETLSLDPSWASVLPEGGVFVTSTGLDRSGPVDLQSINLQPREAVVIKLFEADNRVSSDA